METRANLLEASNIREAYQPGSQSPFFICGGGYTQSTPSHRWSADDIFFQVRYRIVYSLPVSYCFQPRSSAERGVNRGMCVSLATEPVVPPLSDSDGGLSSKLSTR